MLKLDRTLFVLKPIHCFFQSDIYPCTTTSFNPQTKIRVNQSDHCREVETRVNVCTVCPQNMAIVERWPLVEVQLFYSPLFIQSSNKQLLCYLIFCLQVICCIYLSTGGMLFAHMTHPILPSTCGLDCSTMKINFKRQGFLKILMLLRYSLHLQS